MDRATAEVRHRSDFRVVHFSVQGNRVHLIVEADPFSSASAMTPRGGQAASWPEPPTRPAETWLLRTARG